MPDGASPARETDCPVTIIRVYRWGAAATPAPVVAVDGAATVARSRGANAVTPGEPGSPVHCLGPPSSLYGWIPVLARCRLLSLLAEQVKRLGDHRTRLRRVDHVVDEAPLRRVVR